MRKLIALVVLAFLSVACTEQIRSRTFGGDTSMDLKAGVKLEMMTWKEADVWLLTRPMRPGEKAEVHRFQESSSYGVMQGSITVREHGAGPEVEIGKVEVKGGE